MNQSSSLGMPASVCASRNTPRFKCRKRQPSSLSSRSPLLSTAVAGAAPIAATEASVIRGALSLPSRRSLNEEALRVDGRTLTIALRAARGKKTVEVHADQIRSGRKLLERVLTALVGNGERVGAAERGDHRAIERLADLIGDLAFDQPGVGCG